MNCIDELKPVLAYFIDLSEIDIKVEKTEPFVLKDNKSIQNLRAKNFNILFDLYTLENDSFFAIQITLSDKEKMKDLYFALRLLIIFWDYNYKNPMKRVIPMALRTKILILIYKNTENRLISASKLKKLIQDMGEVNYKVDSRFIKTFFRQEDSDYRNFLTLNKKKYTIKKHFCFIYRTERLKSAFHVILSFTDQNTRETKIADPIKVAKLRLKQKKEELNANKHAIEEAEAELAATKKRLELFPMFYALLKELKPESTVADARRALTTTNK